MDGRRDRARAAVAALLALALSAWAGQARAQSAGDLPPAQAPQAQTAPGGADQTPAPQDVVFSSHALSRMLERGVNMSLVEDILATRRPFRYYHAGRWEQGYYDPDSRLFIAMADHVVITVITDVTPQYVARLKRAKPGRRSP